MSINDILGKGAYAVVLESTDRKLAIKRIDRKYLMSSLRELAIVQQLTHPNIIKIESIAFTPEFVEIRMKKYSCNLTQYMKNPLNTVLENARPKLLLGDIFNFAHDLCAGLAEIHRCGFIHGDIKPQNLLISFDTTTLVICDFGVSVPRDEIQHLPTVQTSTYRAPEVHLMSNRLKYTPKIDMWSVGCVLYELATLRELCTFNEHITDSTIYACKAFGLFCDNQRQKRVRMLNAVTATHIMNTLLQRMNINTEHILFSTGYVHLMSLCLFPNVLKRINSADAYTTIQSCMMKYRSDNDPEFKCIAMMQPMVFKRYAMGEMSCLYNIDNRIILQSSFECLNYAECLYRKCQQSQLHRLACIYIAVSVYSGSMPAVGLIKCDVEQLYDCISQIFVDVLCITEKINAKY